MSPARRFAFADILHVLDALPVGVLMTSPDGKVLHLNTSLARLTGVAGTDVYHKPCRHVLRSVSCVAGCSLGCRAHSQRTESTLWNTETGCFLHELETGALPALSGVETDIITRKKRKVPVRLTHFPVFDVAGTELFRLDIVEDMTEIALLKQRLEQQTGGVKIVGKSAPMERIAALIPSIAPSSAPVLISGETGTGKDLLAEALHQASSRSRETFARINISPLPEKLLVAELFGTMLPGQLPVQGRLQQAAGGTLYITEVADIPHAIQPRLVSFLDEGMITPVGSRQPIPLNIRLITATTHTPESLVQKGLLSPELFHRLNVVHLALPRLADRREDVGFLLQHFLELFATRFKKKFSGFTREALALLGSYAYPGNIRELRNIVEYAAMVCPEGEIGLGHLPAHLAAEASLQPQKKTKRAAS